MARFEFTTAIYIDAENEDQAREMFADLYTEFQLNDPFSWEIAEVEDDDDTF